MPSRSQIPAPEHKVGDHVNGFVIDEITPIEDIKALVYEATHEKTGAKVIHIHCNDEENMFSVGFKTPPPSSSGVAHILEHSVLAGSEQFPVKDAFKELGKRTLSTFLNAMTWPDRTIYPTCSAVQTDYFNLAKVYADLAFNPRLSLETFLQEGHHLELSEATEEKESELTVTGVVYNEMKGAYSSPEQYIHRKIQQYLLPDTIYNHDSGGDPDLIPELTYEQFLDFHRTYYSPSNARFLLYGDVTLGANLSFLEETLAPFDRVEVDSDIKFQTFWDAPRENTFEYPIGADEDVAEKTFVVLSWLVNNTADTMESLILDVALDALTGSAAGPVRKALVDSGLGQDVFPGGTYSTSIQQSSVSIGLRGTEVEHIEAIEKVILESITKALTDGINPELIEASFHQIEFAGKEISPPFPIMLMMRMNQPWYFGGDPKSGLQFGALADEARSRYSKNPRVFEESIQRWLLDNPHRLRTVMTPSATLAAEREEAFKKKMAAQKEALTPDEMAAIKAQSVALKAAQEAPETAEALASIPSLDPAEIPSEIIPIPTELKTVLGVNVYEHEIFSNGIGYVNLSFDIRDIEDELTMYLPFLGRATRGMGAAGMSYGEMSTRIGRHTGGVGLGPGAGRNLKTNARHERIFVGGRSLEREASELFQIVEDLLLKSDMSDHKRLRDLARESGSQASSSLTSAGHSYAYSLASSGFGHLQSRRERWSGISQVKFLRELAESIDENVASLAERLSGLQKMIFTRSRLEVHIGGDPALLEQFRPALARLIEALPEGTPVVPAGDSVLESTEAGIVIPSLVNYVGQVMPVPGLESPSAPAFTMLSQIVSDEFLYQKLRVQGNAYGAYAMYSGESGMMTLLSYRDPNLAETFDVYEGLVDFLESDAFNDEMIDASRLGIIGSNGRVLSPAQKISVSRSRRLLGWTDEDRLKFRNALLTLGADEIRALTLPHIKAGMKKSVRVVSASKEALTKANETMERKLKLINPLD